MANKDGTSPLIADSDRALNDGRGRSANYGLGQSSGGTKKDNENNEDEPNNIPRSPRGSPLSSSITSSFPIKKIAFRVPGSPRFGKSTSNIGSSKSGEGGNDNVMTSAQIRALQEEQEEFEAIKREARAAGEQACKLAHMGIVPGLITNDGETTKITCLAGSFGVPVTDANKKKKKKKPKTSSPGKGKVSDANTSTQQMGNSHTQNDHRGEEKEEIKEEEDEEEEEYDTFSDEPSTFATRTATTSPTELDNATSISDTTKSSISSFMGRFKKQRGQTKKKKKNRPVRDEALEEANDLIACGAWMCGVCGTPFDTSDNANSHEKLCLVDWLKHDKLVRQGWRDQQKPKNTSGVPVMFLESKQPLDYPEYLPPRTGGEIPLSSPSVRKYLLMTDEALVNVARRQRHIMHEVIDRDLCALSLRKQMAREDPSSPGASDDYTDHDKRLHEDLFVWERGYDAVRELELASRDRHYYASLEQRAMEKRFGRQRHLTHHDYYYHRMNRIQSAGSEAFNIPSSPDGKGTEKEKDTFSVKAKLWGRIKGRFDHAYKLVKEGPTSPTDGADNEKQSQKDDKDSSKIKGELKHNKDTLYINVVVKNSVQVVNNELQRIARGWWQTELTKNGEDQPDKEEILDFQFEWIRAHTQNKVIRLAGMALASDFTPRKVAVQLSKDLHSNLEPQLKPKGVTIQAVIEYRESQYFVLAVNVIEIDWILLLKWVAEQQANIVTLGQSRKIVGADDNPKGKKKEKTMKKKVKDYFVKMRQRFPSRNEVVAFFLFSIYRMHPFFAVPLLRICYFLFMKYAVNKFILNAVIDDIFFYVEKKGMEMQLGIKKNNDQASFMLAALREIRDGEKKGKIEDGDEEEDTRPILGPHLGPAIKDDAGDAKVPADFSPPDVLEFVGLETDLPVGFLRLRWALLNLESAFFKDAFLIDVMKYDKVEIEQWSVNENEIGRSKPSDGVDEGSFLNATLEYSYLMPKSAFVKANMCYATLEILHYDSHCLVIKEKTLTPEVPYGNTFISWTQYSIMNTGKNTCRLICSVEAEFPNGQPMVARQIKSGMRSGTAEKFIALGETICRYADAYP